MFLNPGVLILLLLVPLALAFFVWRERARQRALRRVGQPGLVSALVADINARRRWWKSALWLLALASVVLALARPVWGVGEQTFEAEGIAVLVVLDVSGSMDATDIQPSRIERAKLDARRIFESRQGDQIGLVLFAGDAFVQFPLTSDTLAALAFLDAANTNTITRPGTAIASALSLALDTFDARLASEAVIVLMSDGEKRDDRLDLEPVLERAVEPGVQVHAIGYGTPEGSTIPIRDTEGDITGYRVDRADNIVVTRLEEEVLADIAAATGGSYQPATDSGIELVNLLNDLNTLRTAVLESRQEVVRVERFSLFVLLAVVALGVDIFLPETCRRRQTNV
ncbi:MAG: VWA domain-containing protein [Phototrophicaceae bacterium]